MMTITTGMIDKSNMDLVKKEHSEVHQRAQSARVRDVPCTGIVTALGQMTKYGRLNRRERICAERF